MNITSDAELIAYLQAKQRANPFCLEIIATTGGKEDWNIGRFIVSTHGQMESDVTIDGAMAKLKASMPTKEQRAAQLRYDADKLLAEAQALLDQNATKGDQP